MVREREGAVGLAQLEVRGLRLEAERVARGDALLGRGLGVGLGLGLGLGVYLPAVHIKEGVTTGRASSSRRCIAPPGGGRSKPCALAASMIVAHAAAHSHLSMAPPTLCARSSSPG